MEMTQIFSSSRINKYIYTYIHTYILTLCVIAWHISNTISALLATCAPVAGPQRGVRFGSGSIGSARASLPVSWPSIGPSPITRPGAGIPSTIATWWKIPRQSFLFLDGTTYLKWLIYTVKKWLIKRKYTEPIEHGIMQLKQVFTAACDLWSLRIVALESWSCFFFNRFMILWHIWHFLIWMDNSILYCSHTLSFFGLDLAHKPLQVKVTMQRINTHTHPHTQVIDGLATFADLSLSQNKYNLCPPQKPRLKGCDCFFFLNKGYNPPDNFTIFYGHTSFVDTPL